MEKLHGNFIPFVRDLQHIVRAKHDGEVVLCVVCANDGILIVDLVNAPLKIVAWAVGKHPDKVTGSKSIAWRLRAADL